MTQISSKNNIPIGKKIERLRRLKGIKQETLAASLGISRQSLSKLEQSESIGEDKLDQVAEALGVSTEDLLNFNEDPTFQNNIYDQNNTVINYNFNPIEKIVELYDALLKSEREKNELLEKLLNKKPNSGK